MNNKANLKPILGSGNYQKVRRKRKKRENKKKRTNLSFLVACEGLGVTKKSKSSDVRGCVCVVLVHQPVNARLVFSIGLFVSF